MHGEWNSDPENTGVGRASMPTSTHPGGRYQVRMNTQRTWVSTSWSTPYRLVFAWGWADSSELPPGSSAVEITLVPDGDGTLIRLRHTGLPSEESRAPARRGLEPL